MRRNKSLTEAVEASLFYEQGQICAYTGHRLELTPRRFHIEHVVAQEHCREPNAPNYLDDTNYRNMVACYPEPNRTDNPDWGAVRKRNWPSPAERHLFVSPLDPGCSERFTYAFDNELGRMGPADPDDTAARTTIARLQLDHRELNALRRSAMLAVIPGRRGVASEQLRDVEKLLRSLHQDECELRAGKNVRLRPYCFALRECLEKARQKLSAIAAGKANKQG